MIEAAMMSKQRRAEAAHETVVIGPGEVHVWSVDLDSFHPAEKGESVLSPDEQERAARFHFERDRKRFAAGRQFLRLLLGDYLRLRPSEIEFRYSPHGKPELLDAMRSGIHFNVSHSSARALFAVARDIPVGIDIEEIRSDTDVSGIARRFFSEAEQTALFALPHELQRDAFFACWTRKEAFIKAKGEGLSLPLRDFDVSLMPHQPAEILATRPDADEKHCWKMWDLDAGPGFRAAVVARSQDSCLKLL